MNTLPTSAATLLLFFCLTSSAQEFKVTSPDKNIVFNLNNGEKPNYSVTFKERAIINPSQMGFEFKNEPQCCI